MTVIDPYNALNDETLAEQLRALTASGSAPNPRSPLGRALNEARARHLARKSGSLPAEMAGVVKAQMDAGRSPLAMALFGVPESEAARVGAVGRGDVAAIAQQRLHAQSLRTNPPMDDKPPHHDPRRHHDANGEEVGPAEPNDMFGAVPMLKATTGYAEGLKNLAALERMRAEPTLRAEVDRHDALAKAPAARPFTSAEVAAINRAARRNLMKAVEPFITRR